MRFIYTKGFAVFAIALAVLAFLMFLQTKGFFGIIRSVVLQIPKPLIYVVNGTTKPVTSFFYALYHLRDIATENTALKSQLILLKQQLVSLDQTANENLVLRKELGISKNTKQTLIPCSVISSTAFGFSDLVTLNCGLDEGVAEGQAVISQGYLAAKIIFSYKNSSTARLITSSNFVADAKISKTGAPVQVEGSFGSGIILDKLAQNDPLEKGWLVVTAGINDKIPKNILVGEVGEVLSSGSELFKKSTLVSPVDFNNLSFVFVVKQ
jgi:rod shape-determining protein MreC